MNETNEQEPNEKLNKFAGFQRLKASDDNYHWFDADGNIVSPTDENGDVIWDMNALFKWLIPKLLKVKNRWDGGSDGIWFRLELISGSGEYAIELRTWNDTLVYSTPNYDIQDNPALVFCLAIEKLIEKGDT